jgi:hypothetical protein
MGTFSGTSLPPTVRVGNSTDVVGNVTGGTGVAWIPPSLPRSLHVLPVVPHQVKLNTRTVLLPKHRGTKRS